MGNEESDGSTKRSKTIVKGDYCVNSNPETPTSDGSTVRRPTGRDSDKKKGKCKAYNELAKEFCAMSFMRNSEVEFMRKKLSQSNIGYNGKHIDNSTPILRFLYP
ncbi:hypothetical protein R6Q59_021207 [Mikania micrantha]